MSGERPTLRHVALAASVSVSAASLALRGEPGISEQTRARVQRAAEQLGYRVNTAARGLREETVKSVAILVDHHQHRYTSGPDISLFQPLFLSSLIGTLQAGSVRVTLLPSDTGLRQCEEDFDALFALALPGDLEQLSVLSRQVPVLVGATGGRVAGLHCADIDWPAAIDAVLDHLFDNGAQQPGILMVSRYPLLQKALTDIYQQWCRNHDQPDRIAVIAGPDEIPAGLHRLLRSGCDGVFAVPGYPVAFLNAVNDAALSIPGDLLFAAQAEGIREQLLRPSITTLSLEADANGHLVGEELLRAITEGARDVSCHYLLTPRASTRP